MSQKQYWQSLEELKYTEADKQLAENEFKEELPFDLSDNILGATTPRRDFLKFLGFSTLAATVVAGCEIPVRKAIPYAIKPEDIVPGVPNYYASTFIDGNDYCPIIIKTRDGRPIKVEGNESSHITFGGTSARVQASVLNLYDKARNRFPSQDGKETTFKDIDNNILAGLAGKVGYLVTSTIYSPTTLDLIEQFCRKNSNIKHVVYDAISYSGMLQANEACYGKKALPTYHFDKAKTIVSIGADFLGTWVSPVEFAKAYAKGRRISAKDLRLSKHYQIESTLTTTGASADERATCRPSEVAMVVMALYHAVVNGVATALPSEKLKKLVSKAAKDLSNDGLVVCGSNDVYVQIVVNAINDKIGANRNTINWNVTCNTHKGIDKDMVELVKEVQDGKVGVLMFHGVNPVYTYFDGKKLGDALGKVPVTVSFADRMDETAQKCKFVIPDNNYLESWGDAEPKNGFFSLMQPGIAPLFKTRAFQDSLLIWAGENIKYADYWAKYWLNKFGSNQERFDLALQKGIMEPENGFIPAGNVDFKGDVLTALDKLKAMQPEKGTEIVVYQKMGIGNGGAWSNNPWLLEMPDPITRATWDNYLCVSPARGKELNAELTGFTEVNTKRPIVSVTTKNGHTEKMPVLVVPGMHNDVVAVAVGFGRDAKVGRAAASDATKGGKNAYPFLKLSETNFDYSNIVTIQKTNETYDLAITQTHNSYEHRPIVHEYSLKEFSGDTKILLKQRGVDIAEFASLPFVEKGKEGKEEKEERIIGENTEEKYRENGTLYDKYESEGLKWGMSIDINACTGCGACVVGCMAENNISVVGKEHVSLAHEMHWIRIDRYFSGNPEDADSIQTLFQPMLCQHCDNAPCENVCPVSATNHSSEGLNQMAYNRCIGTKYCANNCPYKVRHFNWMDFNGADCFEGNLFEDGRRDDINDDLTRMVLNPDVTVRSRGVMEKCSFCVQRLQEAKLDAKKEGTPLADGKARTACQMACPSDAILFGNVNDKKSKIYNLRKKEQMERTFYVLEHIHTLPNINYLAKIRNTDEIAAHDEIKDIFYTDHI